jgi:hypothetical protein
MRNRKKTKLGFALLSATLRHVAATGMLVVSSEALFTRLAADLGCPDDCRFCVNFCDFLAFWQARLAARTTAVTPCTSNGGRGAALAIFLAIWTHSDPRLPEAGIKGNFHMPMMDRNNAEVADLIQKWLTGKGLVD